MLNRRISFSLLGTLALLAVNLLVATLAWGAEGDPSRKELSASFVSVNTANAECYGYTAIAFADEPKATSYEIQYYDDYWKRTETTSRTPEQVRDHDQYSGGGTHHVPLTGGWHSPPCGDASSGAQSGTRFSEGKVWAIVPWERPKPSLKVEVSAPDGGAKLGSTVKINVKLTAGDVALTNVNVGNLRVGSGLTVTKKPGLTGLSLGKKASRTLVFSVKVRAYGTHALSTSASGKSKYGSARGSGSDKLVVAKEELALSISAPKRVDLEATDEGEVVPEKTTITVRFTNTGTATLENVSLQFLHPEPRNEGERLDQIGVEKGVLPVTIGDMPPKTKATRTFDVEVTGDGEYQVRALALYANSAGGTSKEVSIGGEFEATAPALYFTSSLQSTEDRDGSQWVKGGSSFFVSGHVENLSDYKHLCLYPLEAARTGNVIFTGPVDIATYGRNVPAPPLAGGLKPGESVTFGVWADTNAVGGTRATVKFAPKAVKVKPGASCDITKVMQQKPLPASQTRTKPDSLEYTVHVDTGDFTYPELWWGWKGVNFFGGLLISPSIGLGDWIQSSVLTAREAVENLTLERALVGFVKANPVIALPTVYAQTYRNLNSAAAVLGEYWRTATPAEKRSLYTQVESVLRRSRDDSMVSLVTSVDSITASYMEGVENAYANGNNPAVWRALGTRTGAAGSRFVIDLAISEIGLRLAKRAPALQRAFAEVGDASVTYTSLKNIPKGKLLNMTEMRTLWGAAETDVKLFLKIAHEENILIGVRGRAPISVKNLDDGAVWKHEEIKPKNVSDIDIKYLGFERADDGLVAFKEYSEIEKAQIAARIERAGLKGEELEELRERMTTRFEEAGKYLGKIKELSRKGVIDVGFNYSENGIGRANTKKLRGFKLLVEREEATGSRVYRPMQETTRVPTGKGLPEWCKRYVVNKASKVLCRLTGDMDGVYITDLNGKPLPLPKLLRVYAKLMKAGWQHPETFSWVADMGKTFWFSAKEKILAKHTVGGQALMEFGPDFNVRATYLDLKKSELLKMTSDSWYANIVGGLSGAR